MVSLTRKIIVTVVSIHLGVIVYLIMEPALPLPPKHHALAIQTIQLNPITHAPVLQEPTDVIEQMEESTSPLLIAPDPEPLEEPKEESLKIPPKKESAPSKSKLEEKKPIKKPVEKKPEKVSEKKTTVEKPKKSEPSKKDQALQARKKAAAALLSGMDKHETTKGKAPIAAKNTGTTIAQAEQDYTESLVAYLQAILVLPEYGDVRVSITILENGTVKSIKIIDSKSKKNRSYIEEKLPKMQLPPLVRPFSQEHTFTISITND